MAISTYTVHEEPKPRADRIDRAERLVFVRDGFSILAAYLGPLWLAANRLWLPLIGYIAGVGGLYLALWSLGLPMRWMTVLVMAVHLVIGFENDSLRRYGLGRRGWSTIGTVTGRSSEECERRFFDNWLPGQPMIASHGREVTQPPSQPAAPPKVEPWPSPVQAPRDAEPVAENRRSRWLWGRRRSGTPA